MKELLRNSHTNSLSVELSRLAESRLTTEVATRANISPWLAIYDALPNPDPVLRKTSNRIEILNEIMRDPSVSACTKSRKAGVVRRKWEIKRGNALPEATEIINKIFLDLQIVTIIREMLDGWGFGFKPMEILWRRAGNLMIPIDVIGKPPEWFAFGNDNELRIKRKNGIGSDPTEQHKFILTQSEASYNNPYGEATFSLAFWPVTFKKGGIKQWAMFLERFGMPHAVGKVPRNADKKERDNLLSQLNALVMDACAVMPDDASVEMLETKGTESSSSLYLDYCRYHDGEISKVILGHGSAVDATPGKLGGNDPSMDVRSDIIDGDCVMIMKGFNDLIKYIFELNPSLGKNRPSFYLYDGENINATRADRDCLLMKSKRIRFSKQYLMKHYGFYENEIEVI